MGIEIGWVGWDGIIEKTDYLYMLRSMRECFAFRYELFFFGTYTLRHDDDYSITTPTYLIHRTSSHSFSRVPPNHHFMNTSLLFIPLTLPSRPSHEADPP